MYSISILVWTNFSIHYQSNDRFLYIPHKAHNAIILCILRKIKSKKGNRGKHDDVGGTMNMICKEIKFLLLQIDWIKVSLLDSNICKKSHKSIQCLSFFTFYCLFYYTYLVWDWCWSFRFSLPDLFSDVTEIAKPETFVTRIMKVWYF